jgi:hypothetical protein
MPRAAPGRGTLETLAKQGARLELRRQGSRPRSGACGALDVSTPVWPDPGMVFRAGSGPARACRSHGSSNGSSNRAVYLWSASPGESGAVFPRDRLPRDGLPPGQSSPGRARISKRNHRHRTSERVAALGALAAGAGLSAVPVFAAWSPRRPDHPTNSQIRASIFAD